MSNLTSSLLTALSALGFSISSFKEEWKLQKNAGGYCSTDKEVAYQKGLPSSETTIVHEATHAFQLMLGIDAVGRKRFEKLGLTIGPKAQKAWEHDKHFYPNEAYWVIEQEAREIEHNPMLWPILLESVEAMVEAKTNHYTIYENFRIKVTAAQATSAYKKSQKPRVSKMPWIVGGLAVVGLVELILLGVIIKGRLDLPNTPAPTQNVQQQTRDY